MTLMFQASFFDGLLRQKLISLMNGIILYFPFLKIFEKHTKQKIDTKNNYLPYREYQFPKRNKLYALLKIRA